MLGSYLAALRGLHRNVRLYFVATALLGFSTRRHLLGCL